jgi:hypothetical protein
MKQHRPLVLFRNRQQFVNPSSSFRRHLRGDALEDVTFRTRTKGIDQPGEDRGPRQDVMPAPHNLLGLPGNAVRRLAVSHSLAHPSCQ